MNGKYKIKLWDSITSVYSHLKTLEKPQIVVAQGGTSCFGKGQYIVTENGKKKIEDIQPGDKVLTLNESTGRNEYKKVHETLKFNNTKKTIELKLKNGQIIKATEDHKFFFHGQWTPLKDIITLFEHGRNMETNTRI